MADDREKRMFQALLDEAEETLRQFERHCLRLDVDESGEELQSCFRLAHNLKGAVLIFGLSKFGDLVHDVEELIGYQQKLAGPVDSEVVDALLKAHSFLNTWSEGLRQDPDHAPDTEPIRRTLKTQISNAKTRFEDPAQRRTATPASERSAQVMTIAEMMAQSQSDTPAAPSPAPSNKAAHSRRQASQTKKKSGGSLRIPSDKVDQIMQVIGELSIHQSILWHGQQNNTLDSDICANAIHLNQKVIKDLQSLVLSLRMQPMEALFQRVERTAREASRDLGKKVHLQFNGADVLLDKTMIELITDPMNHIIRNAVDHGIETEQERQQTGKQGAATLTITASQDTGFIGLTVTDDGRGIDPDLVFDKAMTKGLIPEGAKLTQDQIIQLIFTPGFSTRESASQYSGRGVGLDVVQTAIQELGGTIETRTRKGRGTSFRILLPTTLEIIDGLILNVSDQLFIVPMADVVEIIDLNGYRVEPCGENGKAISLRDALVPVETLEDYLPNHWMLKESKALKRPSEAIKKNVALIIRLPDRSRLALRVDNVISQQQIVVRPLSQHFAHLPGFSGVTILGNGEPGMILSLPKVGEAYLRWTGRDAGVA